jgi:hypothetical protein
LHLLRKPQQIWIIAIEIYLILFLILAKVMIDQGEYRIVHSPAWFKFRIEINLRRRHISGQGFSQS